MYAIACETHFDAAHFLLGHPGKCSNIHGHRWRVRAYFSAENLVDGGGSDGMVADFGEIKPVLKKIADELDHKFIVEKDTLRTTTLLMFEEEGFELCDVDFRPTAENFAAYIFERLRAEGLEPGKVRVYESDDAFAEYSE